jgi:hypothetical protein
MDQSFGHQAGAGCRPPFDIRSAENRLVNNQSFREGIMISRRDLIICSAVTLAAPALAQERLRLFILPKGVTSSATSGAPKRDLEGWLVCNGAQVYRTAYPELFSNLGSKAGAGDSDATFSLPNSYVAYSNGQPVKGTAICPFSNFGAPAGTTAPFDLSSNS